MTKQLIDAVEDKDYESVRRALDMGADPNARDRFGDTVLVMATWGGRRFPDIVKLLLDKGADPNAKNRRSGETPLMQVAARGYADIVTLLLDRGADVNRILRPRGGDVRPERAAAGLGRPGRGEEGRTRAVGVCFPGAAEESLKCRIASALACAAMLLCGQATLPARIGGPTG